ncbi:MAG: efflux RND transporter periplasmic adaptor subunit [Deltaproteobacteria bacterium]|nr:efflux RND transporter periplasmic adaptor subunit [Deltaproteobacteria bacterium]
MTRRTRTAVIGGAAVLAIALALGLAWMRGGVPGHSRGGAGGSSVTGAAASQPAPRLYRCPMHHDVTSTDPKARCPKCNMFINEPVPKAAAAAGLIGVRRAKVERRDLHADVRAAAVVAPDESRVAHIHTKLSGWITRLLVTQTGAPVRRGQPLLAMYSEDLYRAQQEYLTLRRTAAGLTDEAARAELVAAARRRLQLLDMPAAEIDAIEKSGTPRRDVALRSTISGVVLARHVSEGSYVQPGTDLFVVADLSRVWALAEVAEAEAGGIRAGMKTPLTFTAYPDEVREARVAYVYPSVATDTRTVRVRLELANPELKLKPGMYGEARLRVTLARALVVPAEAVLETGTQRYAFVVKAGGTFEPRPVASGRRVGEQLQILSGLAEGEAVVASASFLIDSESGLRAAIQAMRR